MKESLYYLFASGLILGSGPCIGFCAPVLISFIASYKPSFKKALGSYLVFSCAKTFSYSILGAACGIFSGILKNGVLLKYSKVINIFLGSLIFLIGILTLFAKEPLSSKYCAFFSKGNLRNAGILGFLSGFAPCLPLLGILDYILLISHSPAQGALYAFFFGLGTALSPLIFLIGLSGKLVEFLSSNRKAKLVIKILSSMILIFLGLRLATLIH